MWEEVEWKDMGVSLLPFYILVVYLMILSVAT